MSASVTTCPARLRGGICTNRYLLWLLPIGTFEAVGLYEILQMGHNISACMAVFNLHCISQPVLHYLVLAALSIAAGTHA